MSAIAGIVNFNQEPILYEDSRNIMKSLEIFPADDVQTWEQEGAFLGCHAQWITPEAIGERLPFYDSKRQVAITADAIIDNREELFDKLQIERSKRETMPDSQLILYAYYKWGEHSPKYLIGDFAFMIWDKRNHKLFGARDFSGGRTLYYFQHPACFAFCTTIEPLLSLPYIQKQLNEEWIAEFLAITSVVDSVDASITPYKDIEQIPPAHSITVMGDKVIINRYCTLTSVEQLKLKSREEYVEAFQEVFTEAVKSRLRTHLQVGADLSGGLDSGSVVGFAGKQLKEKNKTLHTFSYVPTKDFKDYTDKYYLANEKPFIKSTVDYVGSIEPNYLDFDGRDSYSEIDNMLDIMEMPYKFFENSFWLKGIYEQAHDRGVGILLNGGRGNLTISWGSPHYYYADLLKKLKWIKLFHALDQHRANVGGARLGRIPSIVRTAFPILGKTLKSDGKIYYPTLINSDFAKRTKVYSKIKEFGLDKNGWFATNMDVFEQRKRHFEDVFHWNNTNTFGTKSSLKYSLWKRDSTNDLRVIRFCLSVPEEQFIENGIDRALIRRSTENYLPDKVRMNQSIRGVQGVDWVHRMTPHWNDFTKELEQIRKNELILNYIDHSVLNTALEKIKEGPRPENAGDPHYKILMRLIILHRFLKKFN